MSSQDNRRLMPTCAAIKDEFLEIFGPGVTMTYANENGRVLGRKDEEVGLPISQMVIEAPRATATPRRGKFEPIKKHIKG